MSYRELRNFVEIMRALGYPRLISMENFRKPNFELVADILYWMVKLYDPDSPISDRVEFENERVEFLTSIATLMANKARLKLNTKKLYASDGKAVQELLKLATLLYNATKTVSRRNEEEVSPPPIKVQDVRAARTLATEITQIGAKLYDLMEAELQIRSERTRALRFLDQIASSSDGGKDQAFVERSLRDIIENTKQSVEDVRKEAEELDADQRNLESKISKKQEELERTEKRLKSLENVRPQFMDEAEKLEKELQRYYEVYMEKHRNLDYLEHELEKYRKHEEELMEEQERKLKKMRERLLKEEVELMRGNAGRRDDDDDYNARGRQTYVQGQMSGPKRQASHSENDSSDDASQSEDDRRGGNESEDEELSVNDKNAYGGYSDNARGRPAPGRGSAGPGSIGNKSGGSSSGGRGVRRSIDEQMSNRV
eukprot:gene9557-10562_t